MPYHCNIHKSAPHVEVNKRRRFEPFGGRSSLQLRHVIGEGGPKGRAIRQSTLPTLVRKKSFVKMTRQVFDSSAGSGGGIVKPTHLLFTSLSVTSQYHMALTPRAKFVRTTFSTIVRILPFDGASIPLAGGPLACPQKDVEKPARISDTMPVFQNKVCIYALALGLKHS